MPSVISVKLILNFFFVIIVIIHTDRSWTVVLRIELPEDELVRGLSGLITLPITSQQLMERAGTM